LVQSILFFILGFLCAGFLVALVAPAVWRRAVALTRKRIEATTPLTLAEIQADKDRIRAEFAISVRKLEMELKALREKHAAQLVELNRGKEDLKAMAVTLAEREKELQQRADKIAGLERAVAERVAELEKLGEMYDEASFASSNRQIELVAREAEVEKLGADLSALRTQRKEAEKRANEAAAESRAAREALKGEQKKRADLEKKMERLMSALADREDKLDRREKELALLRERSRERGGAASSGKDSGDEARERLEARLTALLRENKRLKADLAAAGAGKSGPGDAPNGSASLREEMHGLAAEVVHLAMKLDGPDSPIARALNAPSGTQGAGRMMSLADRVRALQKHGQG
jgi:chromosome segregation ATPase